ncbi:MAG: hypothetical protein JSW40_04710, partial [Candidatus Omnitrophota bacterium]
SQNRSTHDFLDSAPYGRDGAEWMPAVPDIDGLSDTHPWKIYFTYPRFDKEAGAFIDPPPVPSDWTKDWLDTHWDVWSWNDPETYSFDTDGDSEIDTHVPRYQLKSHVYGSVHSAYNSNFSFKNVHGDSGTENPLSPSKANEVKEIHIYNTAIFTPYSTDPYVVEWWDNEQRQITGSLIQLPGSYKKSIPSASYYAKGGNAQRYSDPDKVFNYESRFGQGTQAGMDAELPPGGLLFGADSSWREIDEAHF